MSSFSPWKPAAGTPGSSRKVQKVPLKGLFQDGIWHCNCTPRLPATHFQVRKEGSNKGRWFYTCQESKNNGCGFFLWDDDAAGREMRAVISNSRSEPGAPDFQAYSKGDASEKLSVAGHIEASNRVMSDIFKEEEEEFGEWPLSANDEQELVTVAEATPRFHNIEYETPRKSVRFDTTTTPGSKRKREADTWPTPDTANRDDGFAIPSTTRLRGNIWNGNGGLGLMSPSTSPTPTRFRDASSMDSNVESSDYDITEEVMEVLRGSSLDEDTTSQLRSLLNRHALKDQGIARGRDITRLALKLKDAKIAELQQRITALETEREMDKVIIRHFKSDMASSITNKRNKGRGKS